jgi:3-keto-5-aminohexanoate cleavage enzyme
MANGNGQLVEKAVRMSRELGREVASVAEARAKLGLEAQPRPAPTMGRSGAAS